MLEPSEGLSILGETHHAPYQSRSESRLLTTERQPLFSPAKTGLFYGSFAIRIWLLCLPTFKPNRDGEGHTHSKSSTDQNDPHFHRHQHELLLPQIIGQHRFIRPGQRY